MWDGQAGVASSAGVVLAEAAIYAVGIPWLMTVTGMGLGEALTVGLVPFIPGDILKAVVAVALVRAVDRSLRAQGLR